MTENIFVLIEHLQGNISDMSYMNLAAARGLADGTDGEVVAVLLGHNAKDLAGTLAADRVLYADHPQLADFAPEAYRLTLAELLEAAAPRVLLMGDTSIGADIAGGLSIDLGVPLISLCRSVHAEDGQLSFVSQICGGKILAQGEIPEPTCIITMVPGEYKVEAGQGEAAPPVEETAPPDLADLHVSNKNYIEPEVGDVDIAREPVLIAVGRGIQQEINLEYAEDLAAVLNAVICASRPVVDQGWLDTSRLVGKSGKRVNPKIYLSMGVSGAPEHSEGIGDAELFIAINTDPQAPIFDIAHFGAAEDLFELVPALTEKIKAVKGS